jgi:hypothetical protein
MQLHQVVVIAVVLVVSPWQCILGLPTAVQNDAPVTGSVDLLMPEVQPQMVNSLFVSRLSLNVCFSV